MNKNIGKSTYQEKRGEESERRPCPRKETTRDRREERQKEWGRTRTRPQGGDKREISVIITQKFEETRTARAEEAKLASRKKEEGPGDGAEPDVEMVPAAPVRCVIKHRNKKPPEPWERKEREKRRRSCLLYTSPSPRDRTRSRMPSSA